MNNYLIYLKYIREILAFGKSEIEPACRFVADLNFVEEDFADLISDLEEEFGIVFPLEGEKDSGILDNLMRNGTVIDFYQYVEKLILKKNLEESLLS